MKTLILSIVLLSSTAHATSIFEADNLLGELARKARFAWSSSGENGGVQRSFDLDECYDLTEDAVDDFEGQQPQSFIYYRNEITAQDVNGEVDLADKERNLTFGTSTYNWLKPNSYDPDVAPHIERNCGEYFTITKTNLTIENDIQCRESTLQIKDLSYDVIFCEGDHNAYVRY